MAQPLPYPSRTVRSSDAFQVPGQPQDPSQFAVADAYNDMLRNRVIGDTATNRLNEFNGEYYRATPDELAQMAGNTKFGFSSTMAQKELNSRSNEGEFAVPGHGDLGQFAGGNNDDYASRFAGSASFSTLKDDNPYNVSAFAEGGEAQMPQQGANPFADPKTTAVYDQMRQTVSPKEFGDQVLAGAEQVDPQEVAKFKSALDQIQMPPEALDLLNNMVDEILANPEKYAEIRAKYKEMGAPDEILPEQFDAHFFSALNMAVDQMIGAPSGEQAFAKGGIAELTPVSKAISSYGRNGDTMLAHITPAEARMLRRKGGSGTINPKTGLPEFFNLFKEIGNAFKAVGNVVKDFASSTVGRIVTTVALGFFLGPAAASFMGVTSAAGVAAVSGFVGSAGATLAGGGNLSQALKAGAIGGLTAGATVGVTGGFDTAYAGPTTVGGQFDKFTNAFTPSAAPAGTVAPPASVPSIETPSLSSTGQVSGQIPVETRTIGPANWSDETWANQPAVAKPVAPPAFMETPPGAAEQVFKAPGSVAPPANPFAPTNTNYGAFGEAPINASQTTAAAGNALAPPIGANPIDATQFEGSLAKPTPGAEPGFFDKAKDFYNQNISPSGIQQAGMPAAQEAGAKAVTDLVARMPDATPAMKEAAYQKALNAASPNILSTYGPMTAAGIAAIGAFGGFSPRAVPQSALKTTLLGGPGSAQSLLKTDPYRFYIQGLPGVQYYNGSVMKPPGMATGGEVQHFEDGGPATATDQQVADWWATNGSKGYSDNQIAALMDQFGVTPEQFARSIGANESVAADIANRYQTAENAGTDTSILLGGAPAGATTTTTSGGGITTLPTGDVGATTTTTGDGGITSLATDGGGGGVTRSANDQAIFNFFANNTGLTDKQIVAAMNANKWTTADVARVTGTTDKLANYDTRFNQVGTDQAIYDLFANHQDWSLGQFKNVIDANKYSLADIARVTGTPLSVVQQKYALAGTAPTTLLNPITSTNTSKSTSTSTSISTGTGVSVSTNTSIIRTTGTSTATGTSTGVTTAPGGLTSIQAPWFINPQTFAQGTKGVTVPSSTLRNTTNLPTDALSRTIQGDLQAAGPTVTNQTMQEWMDSRGWKPEQVAYATGAGVPEVQTRYYGAKNATILGGNAAAPTTAIKQPYNNTEGITQLMSPTGPLGEFSTRTATPVAPILPVTPAAATLPNVSFNRTDIQQQLPVIPNGRPTTPLNVLAGQPTQYGVTGYTDAYSPFATGTKLMNMGGIAGLAQGGYPRRNGQIDGPGTETSDSIPAMLSDGEFVMTAKAVRAAGKGDRRAGAKRMYALMHQLEQNAARG